MNNVYTQFKSYSYYASPKVETKAEVKAENRTKKKFNLKPTIGAALGVGAATLITSYEFKKKPDSILNKLMDVLKLKEGKGKDTFRDVVTLITTAGLANIGAVLANSKGKTKEQKIKKRKEAMFQIANMAIPMLMTTAAIKTCEATKFLNKVPTKIIGSIVGMTSGAFCATQLTNLGKPQDQKRKYTIKDSVAQFDDVVATVKIGFRNIDPKDIAGKVLPFIYIYSASRAGLIGDNE